MGFAPVVAAAAGAGGPIGLAVAAGIQAAALLLTNILKNARVNKLKTATTEIADQVEQGLKANLDAYKQNRTAANQAAALDNFDGAWQELASACGNPQYEVQGQNCVNERQPGGKWDWFALYRDPIANDTPPDAGVTGGGLPELPFELLLGAGLLVAGLLAK